MKSKVVILMTIAILLLASMVCADPAKTAVAKSAPPAAVASTGSSNSKTPAADISYPYTYNCAHCGMPITVKSKADLDKACEDCACGMKNSDCVPQSYPKKKK